MEITKVEVTKASIKDERVNVTAQATIRCNDENNNPVETIDEMNQKCSQIIHKDLKETFERLKVHLVGICEMSEASLIDDVFEFDHEQLSNYEVTGYTLAGSDENYGVVIIGKKLLQNGQVLNLVSPFAKFEDEDAYRYCGSLYADVQACNYEIEQYLFAGKWGIKQAEFDFDAPEESDIKVSVSGDGENFREIDMNKLQKLSKTA